MQAGRERAAWRRRRSMYCQWQAAAAGAMRVANACAHSMQVLGRVAALPGSAGRRPHAAGRPGCAIGAPGLDPQIIRACTSNRHKRREGRAHLGAVVGE